jgi:hypothetical protein
MVIIVDTSNGISTLKCHNRWYDTAWQQQPPLESHIFTETGMVRLRQTGCIAGCMSEDRILYSYAIFMTATNAAVLCFNDSCT